MAPEAHTQTKREREREQGAARRAKNERASTTREHSALALIFYTSSRRLNSNCELP